MDVCVGKSKVMNRKPVAYLTCNGSPPVGETPSLMTLGKWRHYFMSSVMAFSTCLPMWSTEKPLVSIMSNGSNY